MKTQQMIANASLNSSFNVANGKNMNHLDDLFFHVFPHLPNEGLYISSQTLPSPLLLFSSSSSTTSSRSQWALLDLSKMPERMSNRMPERMLEGKNVRIDARKNVRMNA